MKTNPYAVAVARDSFHKNLTLLLFPFNFEYADYYFLFIYFRKLDFTFSPDCGRKIGDI